MADVKRVDPSEIRRAIAEGDALLVCAYDDAAKCGGFAIEEALSYTEFRTRATSLPQDQDIILFCS